MDPWNAFRYTYHALIKIHELQLKISFEKPFILVFPKKKDTLDNLKSISLSLPRDTR